ncbi:Pyridoxal phosphate-dependent transferase major region subdomain 2, partial [Penicillium taxi]|uniref:Pyridoxal phosphate-dependent transferase major region subdomain 2 n=1 Tax=Penicillium taxi TaxID=168475 RepID=UPI002545661D
SYPAATAVIGKLASKSTQQRLSLISRHLDQRLPLPELNTPFSTERNSVAPDDIEYKPVDRSTPPSSPPQPTPNMSIQAAHNTLLIPGPIEFDDAVLESMGHYAESHVAPGFVKVFGETLTLLRKLFQSTNPTAQPFIIAGSGTLGWDLVSANLIERGENALVLNTGYFGDSFGACLETYGAQVTQLRAPIGERSSLEQVEAALKQKPYALVTITHVDTSTGVLNDIKGIAQLVRRISPETLVIVDGVCSVGSEEIVFDEWDLDVVVTASQKAIGCPPGLSIVMTSGRAIERVKSRQTPPGSYYASIKNWLPIMQNYENNKPSYFATPPTQLIHALHTTLTQITARPISERFAIHTEVSNNVKSAIAELGLSQLAPSPDSQAHGMTAIYLPEGLTPPDILPGLLKRGVIFAAGLHKEIATRYIRFGHMGVSVTDLNRDHIQKALTSLKEALEEAKKAKGL